MTIRELIEQLTKLEQNLPVRIARTQEDSQEIAHVEICNDEVLLCASAE